MSQEMQSVLNIGHNYCWNLEIVVIKCMNEFSLPRTPQHKICPIPRSLTSKDRAIISVYARFNLQLSPPLLNHNSIRESYSS